MNRFYRGCLTAVVAGCVAAGCAGCSLPAPLDEHVFRAGVSAEYAALPLGFFRATEDVGEGGLPGDRVGLADDLELQDRWGLAVSADLRMAADAEVRVRYRDFDAFRGSGVLGRARRFDGRTYAAGERVRSRLRWQQACVTYAHRVAAFRPRRGPPVDVLLLAGAERNNYWARLEGSVTPRERRPLRSGAPYLGVEGRLEILPELLLTETIRAGYWNFDGSRLGLFDVNTRLGLSLTRHLELDLSYELSLRDGGSRLDEGEFTEIRSLLHIVSLGLSIKF